LNFEAVSAAEAELLFFDDFEEDTGWTVGAPGDIATVGIWARSDPEATISNGTTVQPEDDHTAEPGTHCWVTDGRAGGSAGDWDVDGGSTSLTSPQLTVLGEEALISYWRWYSNDEGPYTDDVFEVLISNNGGADWEVVETVGADGAGYSEGWVYHEFLVGDFVAPSAETMLRFVASDHGQISLVEAAVDDLTVTVYYCSAAAPGDANRDGLINLEDHAVFAQCMSGPTTDPPADPPNCLNTFDFDMDTNVDLEDFATFQILCVD
jgi:hypothetical protein